MKFPFFSIISSLPHFLISSFPHFLILSFSHFLTLSAQPTLFPVPLSPRPDHYQMHISLDTETKTIEGTSIIRWKNTSRDTVAELQLHTYLNAFKHTASSFLRETNGNVFGKQLSEDTPEMEWGWIEINSATTAAGIDLMPQISYIQPDDGNVHDQTVLRIPLDKAVLPDSATVIHLHFTSKLPRIMIRTGYSLDDFYLAVQWFPKLGVYEDKGMRHAPIGGWNCHQYHAGSEYYGEFGVYDVAINVPKSFVVGASGICWKEEEQADGRMTYHYHAEDVIDFAWTASPHFEVVEDRWKDVDIRLLIQPEHLNQKDRYLTSVKHAFEFFDTIIGDYPYPNLTIVGPPIHAFRTGAMEYPTLITASTFRYLGDGFRLTEALTVHEFCHQYFMQMVASNEMEEPWLDEGFASYFEERILDAAYGEKSANVDLWGFGMGDHEASRLSYTSMRNPHIMSISESPWGKPRGVAHTLNYFKSSAALYTLQNIIGQPLMDKLLKTYFEDWKFKHPDSQDFIAVANEIIDSTHQESLGFDVNCFFEQVLEESSICDYAVTSISNNPPPLSVGFQAPKSTFSKTYSSIIMLERLGALRVPQEILVYFDNDSTTLLKWDGKDRFKRFELPTHHRIVAAHLDPFYKIHLDVNYLNNSLTSQPNLWPIRKYTIKFLFWLEQLMLVLAALV